VRARNPVNRGAKAMAGPACVYSLERYVCAANVPVKMADGDHGRMAFDNRLCYAVIMIRTQISLGDDEYDAARREASRLGISFAELVRRSLRMVISVDEGKPWMRYAGLVETGDPESSRRIDDIVYGRKD
jgi:hypothetical protein